MTRAMIDAGMALQHLEALDPTADRHIFLLVDDRNHGTPHERPAQTRHGAFKHLLSDLEAAQRDGWGIAVAVNAFEGSRRRKAELAKVRAVWAEFDTAKVKPLPLAPSLRIRTSPGKGHEYLLADLRAPITAGEAEWINRVMVTDHGGDADARDLARVLRLAGTMHQKQAPHRVEIIDGTFRRYDRAEILAAFPVQPTQRPKPPPSASSLKFADRYIAAVANHLIAELADAPKGARNATLNRCAFRLGQLGLGLEVVTHVLTPTALAIDLGHDEIAATIASGATAGAGNPRMPASREARQ